MVIATANKDVADFWERWLKNHSLNYTRRNEYSGWITYTFVVEATPEIKQLIAERSDKINRNGLTP